MAVKPERKQTHAENQQAYESQAAVKMLLTYIGWGAAYNIVGGPSHRVCAVQGWRHSDDIRRVQLRCFAAVCAAVRRAGVVR